MFLWLATFLCQQDLDDAKTKLLERMRSRPRGPTIVYVTQQKTTHEVCLNPLPVVYNITPPFCGSKRYHDQTTSHQPQPTLPTVLISTEKTWGLHCTVLHCDTLHYAALRHATMQYTTTRPIHCDESQKPIKGRSPVYHIHSTSLLLAIKVSTALQQYVCCTARTRALPCPTATAHHPVDL